VTPGPLGGLESDVSNFKNVRTCSPQKGSASRQRRGGLLTERVRTGALARVAFGSLDRLYARPNRLLAPLVRRTLGLRLNGSSTDLEGLAAHGYRAVGFRPSRASEPRWTSSTRVAVEAVSGQSTSAWSVLSAL
jgi:hypothetical protein